VKGLKVSVEATLVVLVTAVVVVPVIKLVSPYPPSIDIRPYQITFIFDETREKIFNVLLSDLAICGILFTCEFCAHARDDRI
jgi:hypothetical protein